MSGRPRRRTARARLLAALGAGAALASFGPPSAVPATGHAFGATYTGKGTGQVNGIRASGSATLTGGGASIGRGALTGSGRGVFTSERCITFTGSAVLRGTSGSITVSARDAQACADETGGTDFSFTGSATVSRGTATFAGARGTLAFRGTFDADTGTVTLSFRGRIAY
jgi:hypothetical protein